MQIYGFERVFPLNISKGVFLYLIIKKLLTLFSWTLFSNCWIKFIIIITFSFEQIRTGGKQMKSSLYIIQNCCSWWSFLRWNLQTSCPSATDRCCRTQITYFFACWMGLAMGKFLLSCSTIKWQPNAKMRQLLSVSDSISRNSTRASQQCNMPSNLSKWFAACGAHVSWVYSSFQSFSHSCFSSLHRCALAHCCDADSSAAVRSRSPSWSRAHRQSWRWVLGGAGDGANWRT